MKYIKHLFVVAALIISQAAVAQHFDPEHRHSVEITSGIPPLHVSLLRSTLTTEVTQGFTEESLFNPSINIAYTIAISEYWDVNVIVNGCASRVQISKYPVITERGDLLPDGSVAGYNVYDYSAEPEVSKEWKGPSFSIMGNARWKWLRTDDLRLYSALGIGFLPGLGLTVPLTPYVTPVGINVGRKHVYGIAELNISSAASFAMAGIGFRF